MWMNEVIYIEKELNMQSTMPKKKKTIGALKL
jgi:hypothetical protein